MPTYNKGDLLNYFTSDTLWQEYQSSSGPLPYDQKLLVFSANYVVTNDGRLVMGAGFAKGVRDSFPDIDLELGKNITWIRKFNRGLLSYRVASHRMIYALQVKGDWRKPADIQMIQRSLDQLQRMVSSIPGQRIIHMNFPGIGLGQLPREKVKIILDKHPLNLGCKWHVWELE